MKSQTYILLDVWPQASSPMRIKVCLQLVALDTVEKKHLWNGVREERADVDST